MLPSGKVWKRAVINFKSDLDARTKWQPIIYNGKSSALCVEAWKFRQKRSPEGRMQNQHGLNYNRPIFYLTLSRQTLRSGISFVGGLTSFILSVPTLYNQFIPAMIFRFSSALFAACITIFSFSLNAQSFAVVLDSSEAKSGQIVCVPIFAQGFTNIVGYQYSLEFNEQVLTFHHTQKYALPDLSTVNFNMYLPGVLTTAWTDPVVSGVSRENGTVLYEVCFTAVGSVGSSSPVTPGGTLPPVVGGAGVYNLAGEDLWNPDLNDPGLVEINLAAGIKTTDLQGTSSFQLSPNPTSASAQVSVKSAVSGFAMLTVTDASGRTILEQKISLRVGDNAFEIPAKVLNTKGMYQVSVQTDKGVSAQMLSVN